MYEQYVNQSRLLLQLLPLIKKYPHFALKGGTAINFFIRDFPRLSVDIDLSYIKINSREEALTEITSSMESLDTEIKRRFNGSRTTIKRKSDGSINGMIIQHENATVKVEPNQVIRGTVHPPEIRTLSNKATEFFKMEIDFPVLSLPDLYGGKICAALDRQHPRDLFDMHQLLENKEFDRSVFEAFLVYLISHPRPMAELINPNRKDISDSFEKEFKTMTDLNISLENLVQTREELIFLIQSSFNDNDKSFLLSLKDNSPQWDLLNVKHASTMPAVIWKCMNIGKMKEVDRELAWVKLEKTLNEEF